jgi:acetyl-CoA carboxylase biotin carboxyl carrier protein
MPDPVHDGHSQLAELREQVGRLAGELAGSLQRIRVRSGEATIEVVWQAPRRPVDPDTAVAERPDPDAGPRPAEGTGPEDGTLVVASPMVGTFYHAPEPGAEPYVRAGDVVEAGQVVGIVEAMKLMNPVVAEAAGTVVAVLVGNAAPVEFGQPLVVLDPAGAG